MEDIADGNVAALFDDEVNAILVNEANIDRLSEGIFGGGVRMTEGIGFDLFQSGHQPPQGPVIDGKQRVESAFVQRVGHAF